MSAVRNSVFRDGDLVTKGTVGLALSFFVLRDSDRSRGQIPSVLNLRGASTIFEPMLQIFSFWYF